MKMSRNTDTPHSRRYAALLPPPAQQDPAAPDHPPLSAQPRTAAPHAAAKHTHSRQHPAATQRSRPRAYPRSRNATRRPPTTTAGRRHQEAAAAHQDECRLLQDDPRCRRTPGRAPPPPWPSRAATTMAEPRRHHSPTPAPPERKHPPAPPVQDPAVLRPAAAPLAVDHRTGEIHPRRPLTPLPRAREARRGALAMPAAFDGRAPPPPPAPAAATAGGSREGRVSGARVWGLRSRPRVRLGRFVLQSSTYLVSGGEKVGSYRIF
uniref:Uncharacterized protein n=1 Tax=Aegilops tauschii subsp. strangulata TaxID=200361 RepID=A0A453KAU3_AEGTS